MQYRTCTVKFYQKILKHPTERGYPIYGRIIYARKKAEFTTGEHLPPKSWDAKKGMPIRSPRVKEKLLKIQNDILDYKRELEYKSEPITAKKLRDNFKHGSPEKKGIYLLQYFQDYIHQIEQ